MKWLTGNALLVAIVSALILRGSFLHQVISIAAGFYLLPLAILFLVVWALSGVFRRRCLPANFGRGVFTVGILFSSILLSYFCGKAIYRHDIKRVRDFVSTVTPELDSYLRKHGKYPDTLSGISVDLRKPSILSYTRDRNDTQKFSFYYADPAGMIDGYAFYSEKREWLYVD